MSKIRLSNVLSNWSALPKSKKDRLDWLKKVAGASVHTVRAHSTSALKGGKSNLSSDNLEPAIPVNTSAAVPEPLDEKIVSPLRGSDCVDLLKDRRFLLFNCESKRDPEIRAANEASRKFTMRKSGKAIVRIEEPKDSPLCLTGVTGYGFSIYVSEPDSIRDFGLWVFSANGGRFRWSSTNSATPKLKHGWNNIRFAANWMQLPLESPQWGQISSLQLYVETSSITSFNIGEIWAETRPKASLIFIHDGGYSNFDGTRGYQDLLDRGIPVTWAVDCAVIGDATHVSRERLIEVGNENNNLISFHGWNMAISNDYTEAAQALEETTNCQKWLQELPTKGNTGWKWRSAWMQNRCPFSPATDHMVELNPMWNPNNLAESGPTMWPLQHPYNYYRHALHGLSTNKMRALFEEAKRTHGVLICYTHNIGEEKTNISPELWDEFLRAIDVGISEGWLEGVTFETLTDLHQI